MATCDYCGASYRGGAIKDGPYRYCTSPCLSRRKRLASRLQNVSLATIDAAIEMAHREPCNDCGQHRSVDVFRSYRVSSALIYTRWETGVHVVCVECARKRQWSNLACSAVFGWWSGRGMISTPFYILFNVIALLRRYDPASPSESFRKYVRMDLARHLAAPVDQAKAGQIGDV
jgi:hypothetical protein